MISLLFLLFYTLVTRCLDVVLFLKISYEAVLAF